jgi:hypothetical protein
MILRRPHGVRLLQNTSEYSTATTPMSNTMTPREFRLIPGTSVSTANARMAPSTIRKMPTPMLILHRPSRCRWRSRPPCNTYATFYDPKPAADVPIAERRAGQARRAAVRRLIAAHPDEYKRDLAAGSDVTLEDRGLHLLKGIDGDWQLLAVARP